MSQNTGPPTGSQPGGTPATQKRYRQASIDCRSGSNHARTRPSAPPARDTRTHKLRGIIERPSNGGAGKPKELVSTHLPVKLHRGHDIESATRRLGSACITVAAWIPLDAGDGSGRRRRHVFKSARCRLARRFTCEARVCSIYVADQPQSRDWASAVRNWAHSDKFAHNLWPGKGFRLVRNGGADSWRKRKRRSLPLGVQRVRGGNLLRPTRRYRLGCSASRKLPQARRDRQYPAAGKAASAARFQVDDTPTGSTVAVVALRPTQLPRPRPGRIAAGPPSLLSVLAGPFQVGDTPTWLLWPVTRHRLYIRFRALWDTPCFGHDPFQVGDSSTCAGSRLRAGAECLDYAISSRRRVDLVGNPDGYPYKVQSVLRM